MMWSDVPSPTRPTIELTRTTSSGLWPLEEEDRKVCRILGQDGENAIQE